MKKILLINESHKDSLRGILAESFTLTNQQKLAVENVLSREYIPYVVNFHETTPNEDGFYSQHITLEIPRDSRVVSHIFTAEELKNYFKEEFGTGHWSSTPGQSFSKIFYRVTKYPKYFKVSIEHQQGYDI